MDSKLTLEEQREDSVAPTGPLRRNRSELRESSSARTDIGAAFRDSLQRCDLDVNHTRLLALLQESKHSKAFSKASKLQGLIEVLEHLQLTNETGQSVGYLRFDVGYEIFAAHQEGPVDVTTFRDALLHPEHGLCVYVVDIPVQRSSRRFIILKSQDFNFLSFVNEIQKEVLAENCSTSSGQRYLLQKHEIKSILDTMDSEWDKTCAHVLLAANKSRNDIKALGIDADTITKSINRVQIVVQEVENTFQAAQDMIALRNSAKQKKLEEEIMNIDQLLCTKEGDWSEMRLRDLKEVKAVKTEMLEATKELAEPTTAESRQNVKQAVKRQAVQLQESHRLKRRRLGAGPSSRIDSDDEEFVAKAIEEKATYHGRRHETVMYTNRRVKKEDLLNIANYRLVQKGKRLIRSATTIWNRSRPRNMRSQQARKHTGKGLFCTKKPPKTEDISTETTHHQRAHVKNVQRFLFSSKTSNERKFCFACSSDDKAYLRPGTSEGFEKTRNVRILTLTNEGARQLPKYDWPERMMYQTPATHRILNKEGVEVDGKEKLISSGDKHIVIVRPKQIVDSSGTTWANETHRLRCLFPDDFEVKREVTISRELRCFTS